MADSFGLKIGSKGENKFRAEWYAPFLAVVGKAPSSCYWQQPGSRRI